MSDILVSKVILGTLGITPAYDRNVKQAVKAYDISVDTFSPKSFRMLAHYFTENHADTTARMTKEMQKLCPHYTRAKVIDGILWVLERGMPRQRHERGFLSDNFAGEFLFQRKHHIEGKRATPRDFLSGITFFEQVTRVLVGSLLCSKGNAFCKIFFHAILKCFSFHYSAELFLIPFSEYHEPLLLAYRFEILGKDAPLRLSRSTYATGFLSPLAFAILAYSVKFA